MSRRLMAMLLVLGLLVGFSVPAAGQDKDKDKAKAKEPEKAKEPDKGGDKVTLKWKFDKDKVFYQKMVTKTVQSMKVLGTDVNQTQNQTFYFSYKPTKVAADSVEIEQEIIGVAMDIDIGGSKISYDSTKDTTANNPLGDFFKALVGSKFTITLDPKTYKVTKIDGRDQFITKLVAANPQMKQLLETILSNEALKEMAEPTFAVIPGDKAAAKGEKWTRKSTLDMGPIGKYENEYTFLFEGADKDVAKIKVDTVLNYKEPGEVAGQGGLPFKIKSAKLKFSNPVGQITFDNAKGRLDKSNVKLELNKGELKIEIGGQTTDVTLSQTQDSSIETSDTNPVTPKK